MRVAAYVRVSTHEQDPQLQIDGIHRLVAARDWTLVAEHIDHGISGSKDKRPGLDALLAQVDAGDVDGVVVWRLDRLGRSMTHLVALLDRFTRAEVEFISVMDAGIDSTSASGRLMLSVLAAFASFERELLVERTKAGIEAARRRGRKPGRPRREVDLRGARILLDQGYSIRQVASMVGVPRGTLARRLREAEDSQAR